LTETAWHRAVLVQKCHTQICQTLSLRPVIRQRSWKDRDVIVRVRPRIASVAGAEKDDSLDLCSVQRLQR
jgi:hypothetical protein